MANGKPSGGQLFAGAVTLVLGIVTAANGWFFTKIVDHGERITYIEATNFVSAEWLKDRMRLMQEQLTRIEDKQGGA